MEFNLVNYKELHAAKECIFLDEQKNFNEDKQKYTDIINVLKEYLTENQEYLAISAPQLGYDARIFCVRYDDQIKTFVNPIITNKSLDRVIRFETNPSIEGKIAIARPTEVTSVFFDENFKYDTNKFIDAGAAIFEQMSEILDGIIPGKLMEFLADESNTNEFTEEIIVDIIDGMDTGCGIIAEEFETDEIDALAEILTMYQNICKNIVNNIKSDAENKFRSLVLDLLASRNVINGVTQIYNQNDLAMEKFQRDMIKSNKKAERKAKYKQFAAKQCKR